MNKIKVKQRPGQKPELPVGGYAFIIGNGTSRKGIDLKPLMDYGILFGCNWFFHKEFRPHVLVASDEPMTNTILKVHSYYPKTNWFYTWFPKPGSGAKKAPTPEKFAAGPMSTYIACDVYKSKKVFLIGMDFFGFGSKNKNDNGGLNNLYANEKHYQKIKEGEEGNAPTYRNWQRRFQWIIKQFPDVDFYHVNPFEGKSPERLIGLKNFHQITFDNLMEHLTNDAELIPSVRSEEDIALAYELNPDDIKASFERQMVGQENVIMDDPLHPGQVLDIRIKLAEAARKANRIDPMVITVGGHEIMVQAPMIQTREGLRVMSESEIRTDFAREVVEREKIRSEINKLRS
jgi:hypothetical protein